LVVASDVNNPFCGPQGASKIYGPQKGATPEIIEELDKSLSYFAELMNLIRLNNRLNIRMRRGLTLV
jgi:glycerate kinase